MHRSLTAAAALFVLAAGGTVAQQTSGITLNGEQYFEAPGFSFLVFHNNYQVGYQGGLQLIENGERVVDSGDVMFVPKPGIRQPATSVISREVDAANSTATILGDLGELGGYHLICRTDGKHIFVKLRLDKPVDWSRFEQAGLRFYLYPATYMNASYQGDNDSGTFPTQYSGQQALVAGTKVLRIAQEDSLHAVTFSRSDGSIALSDIRQRSPQQWFLVFAAIAPGSSDREVNIEITPSIHPEWRRPAVIGISQVGYHPAQVKRAVIELDPREASAAEVKLYKLEVNGEPKLVKSAAASPWGKFLRYQYEIFDFTDVREPGTYMIETRGVKAGPFLISSSVYDQAWKPTLEYFLPIQMCHVAVREGERTWHGVCHLDDARQAPANKVHIDGYQEGPDRETRFADDEHIPGLDWGGWHDAGDHDLPAGSFATTVLYLALAQEEFHPSIDQTSIDRASRSVWLHQSDGKQDLIEQIEYGVEGMLASFRISGRIFPGIIERSPAQYGHLGDPEDITDNKVDGDDRWVFTNRNTGLQYEVSQSLAVASRALHDANPTLSAECLKTAIALFEYEQQHPPVYAISAYVPRDSGFKSQEIAATAELLLTTYDARYSEHLVSLLPEIRRATLEQLVSGPGWTLIRALPIVDNAEYRSTVLDVAHNWKDLISKRDAATPYRVPLPPDVTHPDFHLETRTGIHSAFVWGPGWNLQTDAVHQYYLHKTLPDIFDDQPLFSVVNFVLGCHPANNKSYVSGVGTNSALIAYGFNRADWSHIPGGIISGASLIRPDMMELKTFPFLWYQTEYVIGGAGSYIFDVLAADRLLNAARIDR